MACVNTNIVMCPKVLVIFSLSPINPTTEFA